MRAAAIFQLSGPRDRIGTIKNATRVPTIDATAIHMIIIKRQKLNVHDTIINKQHGTVYDILTVSFFPDHGDQTSMSQVYE